MASLVTNTSGQKIGNYWITRLLGQTPLIAVYDVRQESTHQSSILTMFVIPDGFSVQARQRFLARFARESAVLTKLHHPCILPVQDAGEYMGTPYLVTPAIGGNSVAKTLKQKGRLTPTQALELLKRLADSIDYAHSKGVIHGTLSPSNILLNDTMQIAGFGLMSMLTLRGLEDVGQPPQSALRSIAGTTLGTQGYIAPEVIQGKGFDGRIDVYALGALALELLSGSPPVSEPNIHIPRVPRLATLCPELPLELDDVLQQVLHPDPARRIQSAGAFVALFAQALDTQEPTAPHPVVTTKLVTDQITLPNAVDWFVKESTPSGKWQLIPPVTAQTAVVYPEKTRGAASVESEHISESIDPFVWWSSMSASQLLAQSPGTVAKTPQQLPVSKKRAAAQRQKRRHVVAMLAGGGVVALGALGFGGVTLAHVLQQPQHTTANSVPSTHTGGTTAKPTTITNPKPTTQPTMRPTAVPTQPPTPTPPPHTGMVIGSTGMGTDSSQDFIDPANGDGSILIHLSNGNFVAYSRACTHEGVAVYYDAGSQKLICPRHNAVFDPANGANPIFGPPNSPLPNVMIRVNADGTITTG